MIFTDYGKQRFDIVNSGGQIFTAPYRCMVVLSDIQYDERGNGNVTILDQDRVAGNPSYPNTTTLFSNQYDNPTEDGNYRSPGAYILNAGQRLSIDSRDDFSVTINYFRLPEL